MTTQRLLAMAAMLCLATPSQCQTTTKVQSVDQIPSAIKSKDGLAKFREQMSGVPLPDGFGTSLPAGLSAKAVVDLVAPGRDASLTTLVGVKPWPYRADTFIAIVCIASSRAEFEQDMHYNGKKPICQANSAEEGGEANYTPEGVYLAVLAYRAPDQPLRLLASYGKSLDIKFRWQETDMQGPGWSNDGVAIWPYSYSRFDFAPYRISATETAFGVRVGWFEGYAGGGADFEGIMLFAQDSDRLRNILAEPIYYMQDLAGDWQPDGTRNHEVQEGEATITMLPHQTNGHFDLRIKTAQQKGKRDFVWSDKDKRYWPVD